MLDKWYCTTMTRIPIAYLATAAIVGVLALWLAGSDELRDRLVPHFLLSRFRDHDSGGSGRSTGGTSSQQQQEEIKRPAAGGVIPTEADFVAVREAYFAAKANSQDPYDDDLRAAILTNPSEDEDTPVVVMPLLEIRSSSFGRGLFTKQAVAKGQPVYQNRRAGIFRSEMEWRRFLELLPTDILRHDVVLWSYVLAWRDDEDDEDEDPFVVALDLDEGSLMNHGALTDIESTSVLSSHGKHALSSAAIANVQSGDNDYLVAVRDIEAGEEILCDYSTFHMPDHDLTWYRQTWDEFVGTNR